MRYLLDTVVVSEYLRKKPVLSVIEWLDSQSEQSLYISQLTVAELKKGYFKLLHRNAKRGEEEKAEKIASWIAMLEARFSERLVPVDSGVVDTWAELAGKAEATGRKLPVIDSLLAATAAKHNLVIVTRNQADFKNCSPALQLYNPYG